VPADGYQTKWVFDLGREYVAQMGRPPLRPSHWDSDATRFELPPLPWASISAAVQKSMQTYSFFPESVETRSQIAEACTKDPIDGVSFPVALENVSLQGSSTLAIYLALLALRDSGSKRAIVLSPVYFSVWDSCESLGIDPHLFPTNAMTGGIPPVEEVLDAIHQITADVVIATDPTFPLGRRWRTRDLEKLVNGAAALGCTTLLDASQTGLHWRNEPDCGTAGVRVEQPDRLVIVQSPSKAFFLHGARFAHVIAPSLIARDMNEMAYVVGGATSALQREVAEAIYASSGSPEMDLVRQANIARLAASYQETEALARSEGLVTAPTQSGVLTMVHLPGTPMTLAAEKEFTTKALWKHGVHVLPGRCFRVAEETNALCFRLSLARPMSEVLAGVRAIAAVRDDLAR